MNLPPVLENAFKNAETVSELKTVIAEILEEYDYGILAELKRRIEMLETKKESRRGKDDNKKRD